MKSLFKFPDSYLDKIKKHSLADGLLATLLFILYCFVMIVPGLIVNDVSKFEITVIGGVINISFYQQFCFFVIVFLILFLKGNIFFLLMK